MIEQRHAIKFFAHERELCVEIHRRRKEHSGDDAMSRSEVSRWIRHIKGGRTDLKRISSHGRTADEGLSEVIRRRTGDNPHPSARKTAQCLGIETSTIRHHLRHVLGMKCCHLRWVLHTVTVAQKAPQEDLAKSMPEILAKHVASHFHFRFRRMTHRCLGRITSERCGHSVLKMLTKVSGRHVSPRKPSANSLLRLVPF
jgi:AraC-like DNA-binding protein